MTPTAFAESATDALDHCRDVTRDRARNFYYGLKLLPEPKRTALYVIYAWMRRADDLADNNGDDGATARRTIEDFRNATEEAHRGQPPVGDTELVALAQVARQFAVPLSCFHDMLNGQLEDLGHSQYQTFEDLRTYCERVASSVGLICIEIWGYRDARALDLAVDRGVAFQLTNILRDFREDYDTGRVYLPMDDFVAADLTPEQLRNWENPMACRRFVLAQAARACSFYVSSGGLEELITPSCAPTLWAMTEIYRGLLARIERHPEQIVSDRRIRLSAMQKSSIALRAKWSAGAARNGNA